MSKSNNTVRPNTNKNFQCFSILPFLLETTWWKTLTTASIFPKMFQPMLLLSFKLICINFRKNTPCFYQHMFCYFQTLKVLLFSSLKEKIIFVSIWLGGMFYFKRQWLLLIWMQTSICKEHKANEYILSKGTWSKSNSGPAKLI